MSLALLPNWNSLVHQSEWYAIKAWAFQLGYKFCAGNYERDWHFAPLDDFYEDGTTLGGKSSLCKVCRRKEVKEYHLRCRFTDKQRRIRGERKSA